MNNISGLADKLETQSKMLRERSSKFVQKELQQLVNELRMLAEQGQSQIKNDTELHHQFLTEIAKESRKANKAEMAQTIQLQRQARKLQKQTMQETINEQRKTQALLRKLFWVPAIWATVAMSALMLILLSLNVYLGKILLT